MLTFGSDESHKHNVLGQETGLNTFLMMEVSEDYTHDAVKIATDVSLVVGTSYCAMHNEEMIKEKFDHEYFKDVNVIALRWEDVDQVETFREVIKSRKMYVDIAERTHDNTRKRLAETVIGEIDEFIHGFFGSN